MARTGALNAMMVRQAVEAVAGIPMARSWSETIAEALAGEFGRVLQVSAIGGGQHSTFHLVTETGQFVLKVFESGTRGHETERAALELMGACEYVPRWLAGGEMDGRTYMVVSHLSGRSLASLFREPAFLRLPALIGAATLCGIASPLCDLAVLLRYCKGADSEEEDVLAAYADLPWTPDATRMGARCYDLAKVTLGLSKTAAATSDTPAWIQFVDGSLEYLENGASLLLRRAAERLIFYRSI